MVDPIADPTPGNKAVIEPTAAQPKLPDVKKLEFTQEELDALINKRLDRAEKSFEAKTKKQIDELTAKIQDFEGKDLGELEKLQKKLEKLTGDLTEKDTELSGTKLRLTKMEALLNAGALPEQITKLLKRVSGTTPEEIESDVSELKEMGWIGAPKTEPIPAPKNQGTGTQIAVSGSGKKTTDDEMAEIRLKLKDTALSMNDKEILAKKLLSLGNQQMLNF